KTALEEYPLKGRATSGVQAAGMAPTDTLVGGVAVDGKGEILVWTAGDQLLRLEARAIPTAARDRKGTRLPDLARDDRPEGIAIA
ncbi:MAG: hypothetical protein ACYC5J_16215, partial [Chloroflexota bacterium]